MVEIKDLTQHIQTKLNSALSSLNEPLLGNIQFKLFTDTGVLQEDLKEQLTNEYTEYINGLAVVGMSEKYVLSNGIEFVSLPLRLEVIVRLEDDEFSGGVEVDIEENEPQTLSQAFIGNQEKLTAIRKVLDTAFSGSENNLTSLKGAEGVPYVCTILAQIANGENRAETPILGYSYSFFVNFYFNLIANGLNSQEGKFYLDGVEIPYTSATFTHIKNADQNLFSDNNGEIVGVPTFKQTTFTFDIPALKNNKGTIKFLSEALKNQDLNKVHVLSTSLQYDNSSENPNYLVFISEVSGTLSGLQNIGLKVTFTFAPKLYSLISTKGWYVYEATAGTSFNLEGGQIAIVYDAEGKLSYIGASGTVSNGFKILSTRQIPNNNLTLL